MGIKLNKDALLQARGPSEHKILAVLRSKPGMKMAEIAEHTGYTKASLHNRMTQMKKRGSIFCEGVNSQTVWFLEKEPARFEIPPEYIQACSIWQVGYRVARDMGALA